MFTQEDKSADFFKVIKNSELIHNHPIDKEIVHKWNDSQVVIGDIHKIDSVDVNQYFNIDDMNSVFYGVAYPNFDCGICFDHPLDHLPLMMIFEMGRQFGIAVSHKFYDIPLTGYINIADSLSFNFKNFLELDKPIYIVCVDSDVKEKKGIHRRIMHLAFLQEGVHCASGGGHISVFKKSLYSRMRTASRSKVIDEKVTDVSSIPTNVDIAQLLFQEAI